MWCHWCKRSSRECSNVERFSPKKLDVPDACWLFRGLNPPKLPTQIIATSAEVTPNGGLVRESPQNALNSS